MPVREIPTQAPVDLRRTLFPLRRGTGDPTTRIDPDSVWRATRTPDGPATIHLSLAPATGSVRAEAWGPGADWILERAPGLAGLDDDASAFRPQHEVLRTLHRRFPGVRLTRTDRILEALIPAVLEQKVTGIEARRTYLRMTRARAEAAPGAAGLLLPPDPSWLASLPYHAFHPFGLERRRAETLRSVCTKAPAIEAMAALPAADARERLGRIPGIGPWTTAEIGRLALADADAVSVGDYHLPNVVAWSLAREPRGDDARMLELLEPYRGQRGRVQLLLEAGGISAPKFGPRMRIRAIERI